MGVAHAALGTVLGEEQVQVFGGELLVKPSQSWEVAWMLPGNLPARARKSCGQSLSKLSQRGRAERVMHLGI